MGRGDCPPGGLAHGRQLCASGSFLCSWQPSLTVRTATVCQVTNDPAHGGPGDSHAHAHRLRLAEGLLPLAVHAACTQLAQLRPQPRLTSPVCLLRGPGQALFPGSGTRTESMPSPTSSFPVCQGNLKAQTPNPEDGAPGHQRLCLVCGHRMLFQGGMSGAVVRRLHRQLCWALSAHLIRALWPRPAEGGPPTVFPSGHLAESSHLGLLPRILRNFSIPQGLRKSCVPGGHHPFSHGIDATVRAGTQVWALLTESATCRFNGDNSVGDIYAFLPPTPGCTDRGEAGSTFPAMGPAAPAAAPPFLRPLWTRRCFRTLSHQQPHLSALRLGAGHTRMTRMAWGGRSPNTSTKESQYCIRLEK